MNTIGLTFLAALRSVGTACAMAAVGVYLHRREFVFGNGKKTLALISQQVTIPLFLFTKIIYCNQDWSDEPCPNITDNLNDIWVLLFWPVFVVGCGLFVGWMAATLTKTPQRQRRSVLASCAFGNSTGLPITLLTVIHANYPSTTELGNIDPTLFLSVYLLLYPVLQWGVGGWLLAPDEEEDDVLKNRKRGSFRNSVRDSVTHNVLNILHVSKSYTTRHRGITDTDASLYISNVNLEALSTRITEEEKSQSSIHLSTSCENVGLDFDGSDTEESDTQEKTCVTSNENTALLPKETNGNADTNNRTESVGLTFDGTDAEESNREENSGVEELLNEDFSCGETLEKILSRCLQPPVVGACLGLLVAATPLRGIFVDLVDRADKAPLEWLFDALYEVGQAAVPLNMIILGCNLSASQFAQSKSKDMLSNTTMAAIVVGKMIVMPIIGVLSTVLLKTYLWKIPDSIDASFYLVAMIVFITPTANNVMVMVELSGSGTNEGIARVIGWQYLCAPILLTLSVTFVVGVASTY